MPYIGNNHIAGDHVNNFKVLDDISSYTATFDGSATSVVDTTNNTIRVVEHRFIQGQRVTYTNGGGGNIGGLTTGTAYFVIFDSASTIKLATSASNSASSTAINLSAVGSGSSHTLNAAFDGVNTKFKITYNSGTGARFNNATQLNIAINNVLQKPNVNSSTFTEGFAIEDNHKIVFKIAPTSEDIFWGSIIANTLTTFDISDHKIDTFTGDGSTTEFTLSHTPANNESLMVTINGVLQHPSNASTARAYTLIASIIQFTAAPGVGDEIQVRHLGFAGATTADVSGFYGRTGNVVLTANDHITTGDITARNINASGILTASSASFSGNVSIGGTLTYEDVSNIDSVGIITARDGIDCNGDLDVDGHTNLDNVSVAGVTSCANSIHLNQVVPEIRFNSTTHENDFKIINYQGNFIVQDIDALANRFEIASNGTVNFLNNVNANGGLDVTGNTTVTGDIDVDGHTNLDYVSVAGVTTMTASGTTVLRIQRSATDGPVLQIHRTGNTSGGGPELKVTDGFSSTSPVYGFWYNSTTGIGNPAANTTSFIQGGSEKLRITSDGKFGFGTASLSENSIAEFTRDVGGGALGASITIRNSSTNSVNNIAELRLKTAHGVARIFKYNTGETVFQSHSGGASDLQLQASGAKNFKVTTNSVERLRIDSSGRVLIGTTTEGEASADNLTIADSGNTGIALRSGTSNAGNIHFSDGTSGADQYRGIIQYHHNGNSMRFFTNATEKLRIDSTGRVLIGTTSADSVGSIDQNVVIGSTTNAEEVALTLNVMEGANGRRVKFFLDDDDGVFGIDSTASSGVPPFVVRVATSEKLRITSAGKVGINQSSSIQTRLHVSENLADSTSLNWANSTMSLSSVVGGNSTANRSTLYFAPYNAANQNCPSAISCTAGTNYQSTLKFFTNVAGNGTGHLESYERLRITSTGILEIERGSAVDQAIDIKTTSTTGASRIRFVESGTEKAQIAYSHGNDQLELIAQTGNAVAFFAGGSERLRISANGHVIPGANNQYDLGSTAAGWRNVYMNDLNLSNMKGNTNDVDGTQGSWTIQEGKDDLYIINRLNGKKFKIKMEEIS